ncbi:MAG TPA: PKD domain-containing protein, partial [Sunxiuqinia sp.]|nr:PKD domain-containing protein [Sunxiuqinia sp.]
MKKNRYKVSTRLKVLIITCFFVQVGFAKTYHVSTAGNDTGDGSVDQPFRSISKAANVLSPGDTVLVSGGIYLEKNIIPASSGTQNSVIVFKADPSSGTVAISHPAVSPNDNTPVFNLSNKNFIWIEGFQFKDFKYGKASISIVHGEGNVVVNNQFENIGNSGVASWDGNSVIWVYESSGNVVRNNYFKDITGDGISLNGQASVKNLVCENTFDTFMGKQRSWDGGSHLYSCSIGIQDMSDGNNVIAFNHASGVKFEVWLDRDGSHNVILRNVAHNSSILVFNESRCASNVIQENIGYDLDVAYETARYETTGWTIDARWIKNIAYNSRIGFYVHKSERDEFRNNIAFNNTDYNLVFTDEALSNGPHTFRNNLWYTSGKTNSIQFRSTAVSVSDFQSAIGETGGLSVNPLFVSTNSGSEDFTLQQSSPALNAGEVGVDMGAYAVYGKTKVGWDPNLQFSGSLVSFDAIISEADRNDQIQLNLRLSKASSQQVMVDVTPVAGDARIGEDFNFTSQTVVFEPGETSKSITLTTGGDSKYDQLVAFQFTNMTNAQAGSKNLRLLRIKGIPQLSAYAGVDQLVYDVDNSGSEPVTLDGSGSTDPNGNITSYVWSMGGEQIATGVNPTLELAQGDHKITLTITENEGKTAVDDVNISVIVSSGIWLEAECGTVGSLWNQEQDQNGSNGEYVTIQPGNNSTGSASSDPSGQLTYDFNVSESGSYTLWARVL